MHPEQEIVNLWLRQQGFFTVNNLNAGTLVIDTLAVKLKDGKLERAVHVEVCGSVSSPSKAEIAELKGRFEAKQVIKRIQQHFRSSIGADAAYDRLLVVSGSAFSLEGVEVHSLQDLLLDVIQDIDRQNYGDSVTRTIQLVRYALLNHPEHLAKLLRHVYPVRKQAMLLKHLTEGGLTERARELLSELISSAGGEIPEEAPPGQQTLGEFLALVAEKRKKPAN